MNFKRLLNTPFGRTLISIILGIGLATLFRKVCTDKNCIIFHGPVINEFENKIYKHAEKCYKYTVVSDICNPVKRIIDISDPLPKDEAIV
jgi:hypothetical protein